MILKMSDFKVTCPLCSREFGSLTNHILRTHKMDIVTFQQEFPEQPLVSIKTLERMSMTAIQNGVGLSLIHI